ncbi:MAG: cation diffusion facilitator family transporter [Muribaculaceae bacterium]
MTNQERERGIYKVTLIGSFANVVLLIFKFVAGFIGNSAAMLADAVHSLSDFVTDIIVLLFVKISSKPEDKEHKFGHGKYETLATVVIGIMLFLIGLGILYNGTKDVIRVINGEVLPSPGILALVAALFSIAVKEGLYQYTAIKGKNLDSTAVIANAWHHRSDALSSIGTAIGIGGAIVLGEKWSVLDPIAAIVVSFFIIKVAYVLTKNGVDDLLERSLPPEIEDEIVKIILSFDKVSEPHHLRTRRIGNKYAINVHIRMDGNTLLYEAHDTATAIERRLREKYGNETYVNIHMEPVKKPK